MPDVTYDQVVHVLRDRLGQEALAHSMRVSETAATMAVRYGVDPEPAKLAGALHDWDRERSAGELLDAAARDGLEVSDADAEVPELLHARTAARDIARVFPGIAPEVVRAVERHTVGSADMGPLDMIVYLADMVEPARVFPGVQELRDAVGVVSLQELFARGYQHSLAYLVDIRRPIHPDTVVGWNTFVAEGRR